MESKLFRDIITNSPNGILVVDQEQNIRFMNKSVEHLLNLDPSSAIGRPLYEAIPEIKNMEKMDGQIYRVEFKEKSYYTIPFQMEGEEGGENTVYFILDLYENQLLRSELSHQKEMTKELEEILEGSFDGILVTDAEGKVLYVNSSYERVTEIRKKDLEGKYMKDLMNPVWMPNSVAYVVAEQKQPVS